MVRPSSAEELLDRVRGLVAALERALVVAICGHGGADKTTLALDLATELGLAPDQVVRTDSFYAAADTRRAGLFELHDWPVLLVLLARVRVEPAPTRLTYPTRNYDGDEGVVDVPMPAVVVIEGIRLIRPDAMPLLDLAVWIDLDPEPAGERAKARNRLQGDSLSELDLWDSTWIPLPADGCPRRRTRHLV